MSHFSKDEDLSEFISPFLKSKGIAEETILVTPKEPSRNKKGKLQKWYLITDL